MHRHLWPQALPDRAQLEPDVSGADHDQVVGHPGETEGTRGIDDGLAVEREERQLDGFGTGRQQDVAWRRSRPGRPSLKGDLNGLRRGHACRARENFDLVLAKEVANAVGQLLDDLVFAGEHRRQVERQAVERRFRGA